MGEAAARREDKASESRREASVCSGSRRGDTNGCHGEDPLRFRRCRGAPLRPRHAGRGRAGSRAGARHQRRIVDRPRHRLPPDDRGAGAHLPHPPVGRLLPLQALLNPPAEKSTSHSFVHLSLLL